MKQYVCVCGAVWYSNSDISTPCPECGQIDNIKISESDFTGHHYE